MAGSLAELLTRYVGGGTIPGAVAAVGSGPDVEVVAVGAGSVDGLPMPADAIMRIQSMTKPITAVAALRLIAAGRLDLDAPVASWLPELAQRRVLRTPTAALTDTVAAERDITVRHLLTNTSGYGIAMEPSPLQQAMLDNRTETGPEPPALGAGEWLGRLAELPLAFQPGRGWRYHHSFGVLGILLARLTGRPLGDHLADELFTPLGMTDTAFWVPTDKLDRLPPAYRHSDGELVETEPAGAGFYAGPPPFDVSHAELVSTARDYYRFARILVTGTDEDGRPVVDAELLREMTSDQILAECKTPEAFYPGFWNGTSWGYGGSVKTDGPRGGRFGWSGGRGTDFYVDRDGTVGVLLTQVEMGGPLFALIADFQSFGAPVDPPNSP